MASESDIDAALARRDREWMVLFMLGDTDRMNPVQASTYDFVRMFSALDERRRIIERLEEKGPATPAGRELRWTLAQELREMGRRPRPR